MKRHFAHYNADVVHGYQHVFFPIFKQMQEMEPVAVLAQTSVNKSRSPALSPYSALSDFSSANVNKISNRYLQNFQSTMEVQSRLDDDTMNSTIQSLESLIYSHQVFGSTLSRTFLNPKSSITNSIYQALKHDLINHQVKFSRHPAVPSAIFRLLQFFHGLYHPDTGSSDRPDKAKYVLTVAVNQCW